MDYLKTPLPWYRGRRPRPAHARGGRGLCEGRAAAERGADQALFGASAE